MGVVESWNLKEHMLNIKCVVLQHCQIRTLHSVSEKVMNEYGASVE